MFTKVKLRNVFYGFYRAKSSGAWYCQRKFLGTVTLAGWLVGGVSCLSRVCPRYK